MKTRCCCVDSCVQCSARVASRLQIHNRYLHIPTKVTISCTCVLPLPCASVSHMAMSRNAGDLLRLYAIHGNDALLDEIFAQLVSGPWQPFTHISADQARKARSRMVRLLSSAKLNKHRVASWGCLAHLCELQTHLVHQNIQFAAKLQATQILRFVCAGLAVDYSNEAYSSLQFVRQFVQNDCTRSRAVLLCPGILEALLRILQGRAAIERISDESGRTMCIILSILSNLRACTADLDRFTQLKGFQILNRHFCKYPHCTRSTSVRGSCWPVGSVSWCRSAALHTSCVTGPNTGRCARKHYVKPL